jgi:hypothetical protein
MDAKTALQCLASRATAAFDQAATARKSLDDALAFQGAQFDHLVDAVLVAEGKAKPWADLMKRIERHGVREGLAKQRAAALETVLHYGFSMSTSLVTNAARMADQDGLRRFLDDTDTIDIDEEPEATDAASLELEPTVIDGLGTTVAQQELVLAMIRGNGVKLHESGEVTVEDGSKPRRLMVEFAISKGWARLADSTAASEARPVVLTVLGEAILAR